MKKKIYLAGPDVFKQDAFEYGKVLREACSAFGFEGLYPLDNEIDEYQASLNEIAEQIYYGNLSMIRHCDVVLANLTRFRGPSMDVGTAFEIGYARAGGKIVLGYTSDFREYKDVAAEFATQDHTRVEDFGLQDNLMPILACTRIYPTILEALYSLKNELFITSQGEDNASSGAV